MRTQRVTPIRNPIAIALRNPKGNYRVRIVKDKTKYSRKRLPKFHKEDARGSQGGFMRHSGCLLEKCEEASIY
jgi:hypothetical protein